jgi:orotate phosphoribosyltransferase
MCYYADTMTDTTAMQRLEQLLRERSLQLGDFVLASGKRSSFYIDARPTTMSGEGLVLLGTLGLERITTRGWRPQFVGGLTLGADPVAYAIAAAARRRGTSLDAFTVRKQAKEHGTGKRIEGCFAPGGRVVIVEDVITTGRSALEAIGAVEAEGASVVGVLAVVDREDGGRATLERAGYEVETLLTARGLIGE